MIHIPFAWCGKIFDWSASYLSAAKVNCPPKLCWLFPTTVKYHPAPPPALKEKINAEEVSFWSFEKLSRWKSRWRWRSCVGAAEYWYLIDNCRPQIPDSRLRHRWWRCRGGRGEWWWHQDLYRISDHQWSSRSTAILGNDEDLLKKKKHVCALNCFDTYCITLLYNHVKALIEVRVWREQSFPMLCCFVLKKDRCKVIRKRWVGDIKTYRARVATWEVTLVLVSR